MSGLVEPDPVILDALVRLQLAAQRLGTSICLENSCIELIDLLALVGLSDVLPAHAARGVEMAPGIEMDRQVEQREQVRVDEEVESGDAAG